MKGMSSPILSPQLRTRRDFFVDISMAIDGGPVTIDVSMESIVSFDGEAVDDVIDEMFAVVVVFSMTVVSLSVVNVVGVVLRRVNRYLFVLVTFFSAFVVPSDSHASQHRLKRKKYKTINSLHDVKEAYARNVS